MAPQCSHPASHSSAAATAVVHPLQALTMEEMLTAIAIVRRDPPYGDDTRFETIELYEPDKQFVREYRHGESFPRKACVNAFSARSIGVTQLIVCLRKEQIEARDERPSACPMIQYEQFLTLEAAIKRDEVFIAGCSKRGITDMSMVCVDPWSAGRFSMPDEEGRMVSHAFAWVRMRKNDNFYAHPIEGLNAVVDIKNGRVIRVDDYGVVPIPKEESNYDRDLVSPRSSHLKPLDVIQPQGVSFSLSHGHLTWNRWSVRIGFNAREGLTLHDIRYDNRPIIYRASLVEMVVPYGSPERGHFRKHVFDIGEYGIGKLANSLKLGCDCLGAIEYLDVALNTIDGNPVLIEKAICIHEEDSGLLWKHTDFRTERTEVRRARRLVISTICTVGNYEYAFYWHFHLDGTIEFEIKATGIINTAACLPGKPGKYGTEVLPGVVGHIHQHIFCARLDMSIDGDNNSFVECNTYAEPEGPDNPHGNAFYVEQTILGTELRAARRAEPSCHRYWAVINPNKANHTGSPVGYRLDATNCVTPFVGRESQSGRRALFTQNHVWVTAYDPGERFPAGEHVNHSSGSGGISDFVAKNRSIDNTNIVLWHSFGLHHPVRMEDFPVQNCISAGFKLMPAGFFDRNPCIDLPPEVNEASCCAHAQQDYP